jgi:8-oxo-dGTP pyrophosphatase MutT (NUDIX family)
MTAPTAPVVEVVAALITDSTGRLVLVRKRGTTRFMQAGGKPEPGESAREALVRELGEELEFAPAPEALGYLGRFETDAANEPGHLVRAEVFRLRTDEPLRPAAEIVELLRCTPDEAAALGDRLAPLARTLLTVLEPSALEPSALEPWAPEPLEVPQ